jgi:UV DNA damage endonuclease
MKIGYPCINRSIGCSSSRTFRLASYSEERQLATVAGNLECLERILRYNINESIFFFRITSDLVPFASHPVSTGVWEERFRQEFSRIGSLVRDTGIRISMHPDQFVVINSPDHGVVDRSVAELEYHAAVLDLMGLDTDAKIQIHTGGVYGDRTGAMKRFVRVYNRLDDLVQRRLVIENDDRSYTLSDCMAIHRETGVPVLFDIFHHRCNSSGEETADAVGIAAGTWGSRDGILMVDYSSQLPGGRPGRHAETIDEEDFSQFLEETAPINMDIMLEIKDKERSARRAVAIAGGDARFGLAGATSP